MSGKTGWEPNISSFGSIISHLIIRPLRLLYHPYLSLLFFFGRAPYAEPCGFPLPPPPSTFAFDYFASNHTTTTLALPSLPISAFFLVEPPTQSRAAFPSPPPPLFTFATSLAASKRGFFSNVYQHDTLKLTGCFTLIIHLLDVPKLWREVTR